MLALEFRFPAGRYHATPWDSHVNEGTVVWPPEPWRVLRALIATWHHKVKHTGKHDESALLALVETLSSSLPEYSLPAASHSHTRHYMPLREFGKTSLVFDAFAAVNRDEPLCMAWPVAELSERQLSLLDDLLDAIGYLGRAESWVDARRCEGEIRANCRPGSESIDVGSGEVTGEIVTLLAPLPQQAYSELRKQFLTDRQAQRRLSDTLPEHLLHALCVTTPALRKQGWNRPPAAQPVTYVRPLDALKPRRKVERPVPSAATTIRFLLIGKPLPRVEDTVRIGELMRLAVMSQAKRPPFDGQVPSIFSGHEMPSDNRHRHAFFLPWDSDGDGRIDRLVLHVPDEMDAAARRMAERVPKLWSREGSEWRLIVESIGGQEAGGPLIAQARTWVSVTPYLHPWHLKKRFGVEEQIRREFRQRGLPEPERIESLPSVRVGHQQRKPIHFRRFRDKRGLTQPDRHGSFWRLHFAEPQCGPIALGFGCHFGLGLFKPAGSPDAG